MARAKKEVAAEKKPGGRAPNPDAQNGVSPPKAGTSSAAVWAACDKLAAKAENGNPKQGDVKAELEKKTPDLNAATVSTQIARWRQFHGLTVARA